MIKSNTVDSVSVKTNAYANKNQLNVKTNGNGKSTTNTKMVKSVIHMERPIHTKYHYQSILKLLTIYQGSQYGKMIYIEKRKYRRLCHGCC